MSLSIKILALALPFMAAITLAHAQTDVVERLNVPGPIQFDGKDFALAWTSAPTEGYFKQEYVPAGQVVETFTDMFLVEVATRPLRPIDAAGGQIQSLQARKQTDPVVNYDILHNENSGEVLLDFVLSDLKADPIFVEWNAYRYVEQPDGEGVVLYGISRRGYGDDGAKALLESLKTIRSPTILALSSAELPPVSVKD
ncbi:hypothetical protein [Aureimonas fodinaquatilis]|uniref:hypothetical protein n=1 Tax=Aureimonas fodinaquatilis TaxID=2565783 RepID=UPI001FE41338|nr:hypothetical protein [Aureimonas fodinaquatilis]